MINYECIHPSWLPIVKQSLQAMDQNYLKHLSNQSDWLPGPNHLFKAFSLPLDQTQYILFGESPYPREISANGYAFWDNAVDELWSPTGLSKPVNRATSLRNFIKMLLLAEGLLPQTALTQPDIAALNKTDLIQTLAQLFEHLLQRGFLLLNATLVLGINNVKSNATQWQPFVASLLEYCQAKQPHLTLILFGKVAEQINQIPCAQSFKQLTAPHPYNLSFITEPAILNFFRPMHLLIQRKYHDEFN